jgi:hypothetical protein
LKPLYYLYCFVSSTGMKIDQLFGNKKRQVIAVCVWLRSHKICQSLSVVFALG